MNQISKNRLQVLKLLAKLRYVSKVQLSLLCIGLYVNVANAHDNGLESSIIYGSNLTSLDSIDGAKMPQQVINGVVKDEQGMPLAGANIVEKGTSNGTQTDFDGNFSINVSNADAILVVSYIGFNAKEFSVENKASFNIVLEENAAGLDEVVVVGYASKTKGELTGSVFKLENEQLASRPQTNVFESLQGAIPGLQIVNGGGGKVGTDVPFIRLRGISSTTGDGAGILVVIDGIVQPENDGGALNQINPDDIENITVLKDAQAAIYGARAAGGVLLVTTKRGTSSKPVIEYSSNVSVNVVGDHPNRVNLGQHFDMHLEAHANDGIQNHFYSYITPYLEGIKNGTAPAIIPGPFTDTPYMSTNSTDWVGYMYQTAIMTKHQLNVSGKSENSNYYASIGYLDQPGNFRFGENTNKRYFSRVKYSFDITDKLSMSTNLAFERQNIILPLGYDSAVANSFSVWPSHLVSTPNGNYANFGGFQSPIAHAEALGDDNSEFYRQNLQAAIDWKPVSGLTVHGDISTNVDSNKKFYQRNIVQLYDWDDEPRQKISTVNSAGASHAQTEHDVVNLTANYSGSFGDHSVTGLLGGAHEELRYEAFSVARKNLITEELPSFAQGRDEDGLPTEVKNGWVINSYFASLGYNYKRKYLLEGNFRRDGSSRFAADYRWGNFWGVSGAWVLSEENFISSKDSFISNLKLRLSNGSLGNQNNVGLFDFLPRVALDGVYLFGNPDEPVRTNSAFINSLSSPATTWETVKISNVGLDFSLFDYRLNGTFDYFIKDISDLLITEEFPSVIGISTPLVNGGSLKVKGWELALNWNGSIGDDFKYRVSGTLSDDSNEITNLDNKIPADGVNTFVEGYNTNSAFGLLYDGIIENQEDLDQYIALEGTPNNLRIGDAKFKDLDGDGEIEPGKLYTGTNDAESGDMSLIGDTEQHLAYSFTLGLNYKGFDFSTFFQGIGKWNIIDSDKPTNSAWWAPSWAHLYGKTWTPENTDALHPRLTTNGTIDGNNYRNSNAPYKWINNKYLRLKNVQIGYTFPNVTTEKIGMENLRIYFSGSNLLTFSNLEGNQDPEYPIARGVVTPLYKSYSLGLNISL
ncbi:SusC/RagA family TonB-linked outer membrane protein [Maribacter ulvicola]|uniref:TonB-linked outer membrane protein, SusC/RagA family n=1 Tax=Maribacter ulvicola TaxID=228959 RepID=A0A1N6ZXP9_9FLAO|nr:TonB-dependent receptor [Maribacter ulvicola]SIR31571.1 TonB-linked outer membrane protein, SusC/RagA family [Maribacter ulvicola]